VQFAVDGGKAASPKWVVPRVMVLGSVMETKRDEYGWLAGKPEGVCVDRRVMSHGWRESSGVVVVWGVGEAVVKRGMRRVARRVRRSIAVCGLKVFKGGWVLELMVDG
jgi:hypothetical protein